MEFKNFLFNEDKYYLGQKAGDLLSVVQDLSQDAGNLGNRALIRSVQGVVNQIRKILHGRWSDNELKYLKVLQKCGVALAKAVDEKEDIPAVVASVANEIQELLNGLEVPINTLGNEETGEEEEESA